MMLSRFLLVILITAVFGLAVHAAPIPDSALEDDILYRRGHATLLAESAKHLPFFLLVDDAGTGYFLDFGNPKYLAPNGVPQDWANRKKFAHEDKEWTKMSRDAAREMWGEPHSVPCRSGRPSIFDAYGNYNGERNLYHLDLAFDNADLLYRYRVRGIGICNAKWITLRPDGTQVTDP